MPISQILPDGKVRVYNTKTGAVKEVAPEELGSISPRLVAEYQSMQTPEKKAERMTAEQTIAEIEAGPTAKKTEGEKTKYNLAKTGLKSLKNVKQFYTEDPEIINKQLIPGKFESRSFDASLFGAVDTLLRIRTGATAPEQEIRRYMSAYGPSFGDKPKDVDFKIDQLKNALISEGNLSQDEVDELFPQKIEEKPKLDKEKQIAGTALQMPSTGLPEGLTPLSTPISPEEQVATMATDKIISPLPMEQQIAQQAIESQTPQSDIKSRVLTGLFPGLQVARIPLLKNILAPTSAEVLDKIDKGEQVSTDEIVGTIGETIRNATLGGGAIAGIAGGVISGLTKTGASPEERLKSAAIEGGMTGALAGSIQLLGGITNKIFKPKYAKEILDEGTKLIEQGSKARKVAVDALEKSGKTIQGENIINSMKKWKQIALDANPGNRQEINKIYNGVSKRFGKGRELKPSDAFDIWFEIDSGFSSSGTTKTTVGASADRALRDTFRNELGEGFDKATKTMREGFKIEETMESIRKSIERGEIKEGLMSPAQRVIKRYAPSAIVGATFGGLSSAAVNRALGRNTY